MTTAIKERPIIFSAAMVRAILDGWKTQTRRIDKRQNDGPYFGVEDGSPWYMDEAGNSHERNCPYGKPGDRLYGNSCEGDRLWVREAWAIAGTGSGGSLSDYRYHVDIAYRADNPKPYEYETYEVSREIYQEYDRRFMAEDGDVFRWRSPIHMPRWASRLTLEITDVRVQRVQDISVEDVWAEGFRRCIYRHGTKPHIHFCDDGPDACVEEDGRKFVHPPRAAFGIVWNQINGAGSWEINSWVWAISFKRVEEKP